MFGINQVSWGEFIKAILFVLLLWYLSLILLSFFKRKGQHQKTLFEDDFSGSSQAENLEPVSVLSQDFPSEMIPLALMEAVILPVPFYEEVSGTEGFSLERFQDSKDSLPPSVMEQIQFQQ